MHRQAERRGLGRLVRRHVEQAQEEVVVAAGESGMPLFLLLANEVAGRGRFPIPLLMRQKARTFRETLSRTASYRLRFFSTKNIRRPTFQMTLLTMGRQCRISPSAKPSMRYAMHRFQHHSILSILLNTLNTTQYRCCSELVYFAGSHQLAWP